MGQIRKFTDYHELLLALQNRLDAYCIADDQQQIVGVNSAFALMYGYEPETLVGMPLSNMLVEADRAAFGTNYRTLMEEEHTDRLKYMAQNKNGDLFAVIITPMLIELEGHGRLVVSLMERLDEDKPLNFKIL